MRASGSSVILLMQAEWALGGWAAAAVLWMRAAFCNPGALAAGELQSTGAVAICAHCELAQFSRMHGLCAASS